MQRRQAPVLNDLIESKRGTLWLFCLSSIFDTSDRFACHHKWSSHQSLLWGKAKWFTRVTNTTRSTTNSITSVSCIGPLCCLLFDKPAILGWNISIYSAACWYFSSLPLKSSSRQRRRQRLEVKHQGLRARCVLSWAFLFPARRAYVGTERKTQNRHSSADSNDWALSGATVPQCAACSVGNFEGGTLLCNSQMYHFLPSFTL